MGEIERYMPPATLVERRRERYINRGIARMGAGTELAIAAENGRFDVLKTRINNGADLTQIAVSRLVVTHNSISALTHESPKAEMDCRMLQDAFAFGAGQLIAGYMRGDRA